MLNLNLSIENKAKFQIIKISVVDNTYVKLHRRFWHVDMTTFISAQYDTMTSMDNYHGNASLLSKQIIW